MREIRTSININAPREKVWQILTNFEQYPTWNPFLKAISGDLVKGERLEVQFEKMTFKPVVTQVEEFVAFSWLGNLWFKGLFDGEHRFFLEEHPDQTTTLHHSEQFKGLLVGAFRKMLDGETTDGFHAMNRALKERAENE